MHAKWIAICHRGPERPRDTQPWGAVRSPARFHADGMVEPASPRLPKMNLRFAHCHPECFLRERLRKYQTRSDNTFIFNLSCAPLLCKAFALHGMILFRYILKTCSLCLDRGENTAGREGRRGPKAARQPGPVELGSVQA